MYTIQSLQELASHATLPFLTQVGLLNVDVVLCDLALEYAAQLCA